MKIEYAVYFNKQINFSSKSIDKYDKPGYNKYSDKLSSYRMGALWFP